MTTVRPPTGQGSGASADADQALVSDGAASVSTLTGFDPSRVITAPPILPPYLRGPERRREGVFIVPDIRLVETQTRTRHDNTWTIHYVWMNRVWGFFDKLEIAHVNSRLYRQWLETYEMKNGIPPHIQFGGAVVAGSGDPDFHTRWVAYAQEAFV
jgi:hypothetical protein